ncbi:unnamed protein product, partial [Polarella glacialis]
SSARSDTRLGPQRWRRAVLYPDSQIGVTAVGGGTFLAACGHCQRLHRRQRRRCDPALAAQDCRTKRGAAALGSEEVLRVAEIAARAAGQILASKVGADVVKTKAFAADLLTEVDSECEEVIRALVKEAFPEHAFLGEETAGTREAMEAVLASPDWLWVVDPIDGTTNFVAGQPMSAVSIGVAFAGELQ